MMLQRPLGVLLSVLLLAHHAKVLVSADADAALLPQAQVLAGQPAGQQQQSSLSQAGQSPLPPLIAALSVLRDPSPLTLSIAPSSDASNSARSNRPRAAATALAVPGNAAATTAAAAAPLETLRPAAAAALARQHENPSAPPMTDDDIAAINILLSREGPPSQPYCYDTGLSPNATTAVPHLMTFGNRSATPTRSISTNSTNSSMQSVERLGRMSTLGPLSWLARTFAVSGDSLMKLRITQQLQLILQDAICDSAASAAELPPNQVVTFGSSNLTLSLDISGVDWDDAVAPKGQQSAQQKGLLAVQKALQQLTGNYDPGHTLVSFEAFPSGPTRTATRAATAAAGKGQKQRAGAASAALLSGAPRPEQPPTAATSARKLLRGALAQPSSSSSSGGRVLLADGVKTVYVRLYGADPMNLTTLVERLGNCSTGPAPSAGRMPQMPAGQPLAPSCAEVFRKHFVLQGVRVQQGSGFSVAHKAAPQAAIELSVAIGLTLQQQEAPADSDTKASAWLNSTAMQDILGTFNLTVASSDADYLTYLRDPQSGRYPILPGFNVSSLLPALFQQVLEASKDLEQQQQQPQQPQQQQGGSVFGAPTALSRSILAGIIVAVVASVLALLGVVVLLLRRRGDRGNSSSIAGLPDSGAGPNRRRKRRPRVYHTKYLPDGGPVLGRDPDSDAATTSAGPAAAAAAAAEVPRRVPLERGDSVMSQVHIEMDDAQDEADQGSQASGSSASASGSPSAAAAAAAAGAGAGAALSAGVRAQQQHWQGGLQRQEGEAGSGGSSVCSQQRLLGSIAQPSDSGASTQAAARLPDDASVWESSTAAGSVSGRTVSAVTDLTAHSSVLSPWASNGEQLPQGCSAAEQKPCAGTKHRLAVVSQAASPSAVAAGAEGATEGPGSASGAQGVQAPQQQPAAGSTLSMASAFAAMSAQLDAAVRAGSRHTGGGNNSSGGGSSTDSAAAIQPLGMSCWHKDGHVSGFYVPDAAAASSSGGVQQQQQPRPSAGGGLVSPFAAAIQLAQSVASDEV